MNNPVLTVQNLSFAYNSGPVLQDVNLAVREMEFVWVVGPNGGGKTTLLKLFMGLLRPQTGEIKIFGLSPEKARRQIGYMPQAISLDSHFPASVMDVALLGRLGGSLGPYGKEDREAAEESLESVGLSDHRSRPFSSLSGGQQRKLLIARALACRPKLLLLDEPTANLDLVAEQDLFELLDKLNGHLTIVMVSHNPTFVSESARRVLCVNRRVAEHPTSKIDEPFLGEFYDRHIRLVQHNRHFGDKGKSDA